MQIYQDRKIEKSIKLLEKRKESLSKKENIFVEIMLEQWMTSKYAIGNPNITNVLTLAALIPLSTAEVERSVRLMKLIFA